MLDKNVICTVKCVINFQDGNRTPSEVKRGEIIEVTEVQLHGLQNSAPKAFQEISRRLVFPKVEEEPEEEIFDTPDYGEDISQEQYGIENVVDWKPVPWYAAQLAREPASEEA